MKREKFNIFESIVTVAILLVVVHTFLEDFAVLIGWGKDTTQLLMILGFCFDLFFTIEFLVRLYYAFLESRAHRYFFYEKGWIDFLASIPLLMFNSGPELMASLLGGSMMASMAGMLNMLKLIKAIRIARILRLLRILKVFRKIKYADSKMAQRHIAKIITIGITSLVFTLFVANTLSEGFDIAGVAGSNEKKYEILAGVIEENRNRDYGGIMNDLRRSGIENDILVVKVADKTLYSRYILKYYTNFLNSEDYGYAHSGPVEIFYDLREYNIFRGRLLAKDSLIFFFIVVVLVGAYLVIYSPHFAITITDPIFVMRKGFKDDKYNLNVKIQENYKDDDIYELSRLYNEIYLPLKDRSQEEESSSTLEINDFKDLLKPGELE